MDFLMNTFLSSGAFHHQLKDDKGYSTRYKLRQSSLYQHHIDLKYHFLKTPKP